MRAEKVHAEKSAREKCTQNGLNKKNKKNPTFLFLLHSGGVILAIAWC